MFKGSRGINAAALKRNDFGMIATAGAVKAQTLKEIGGKIGGAYKQHKIKKEEKAQAERAKGVTRMLLDQQGIKYDEETLSGIMQGMKTSEVLFAQEKMSKIDEFARKTKVDLMNARAQKQSGKAAGIRAQTEQNEQGYDLKVKTVSGAVINALSSIEDKSEITLEAVDQFLDQKGIPDSVRAEVTENVKNSGIIFDESTDIANRAKKAEMDAEEEKQVFAAEEARVAGVQSDIKATDNFQDKVSTALVMSDELEKASSYLTKSDATGITGLITQKLPESNAAALRNAYDVIRSNVGMAELKAMKDRSKGGDSGLGQLTANEMEMLISIDGKFDENADPAEQLYQIQRMQKLIQDVVERNDRNYRKLWSDKTDDDVNSLYRSHQAPEGVDSAEAMFAHLGKWKNRYGGILSRGSSGDFTQKAPAQEAPSTALADEKSALMQELESLQD